MSARPARKHDLRIDNPETALERFTDFLGRLVRVSTREIPELDRQQRSERTEVEKKRSIPTARTPHRNPTVDNQ